MIILLFVTLDFKNMYFLCCVGQSISDTPRPTCMVYSTHSIGERPTVDDCCPWLDPCTWLVFYLAGSEACTTRSTFRRFSLSASSSACSLPVSCSSTAPPTEFVFGFYWIGFRVQGLAPPTESVFGFYWTFFCVCRLLLSHKLLPPPPHAAEFRFDILCCSFSFASPMADSLRSVCLRSRPRVVILDESTSALDLENEVRVYDLLLQLGVTVVSVGNRPSLVAFHDRILRMMGDGEWQMEEPQWKIDQAR